MLLRICIQTQIHNAQVHVKEVSRHDGLRMKTLRESSQVVKAFPVGPLDRHRRVEPGGQAKFTNPVSIPPRHILGGGDPWLNDFLGQSFRDDLMGHLGVSAGFEPSNGYIFGTHHPGLIFFWQRFHQLIVVGG